MKNKFILGGFAIALFSMSGLAQNRTVTNGDLTKYRERRIRAEAEYERQARDGKAPTRAELERRELERRKFYQEFSEQAALRQQQTENVFQSQAAALRADIAQLDAEINYVRQRVGEIPEPQTFYSVGYLPYAGFGFNNFGGGFGGVGFPQFPTGANNTNVAGGGVYGSVRIGGARGSNVVIGGGYNQTTINQTNTIGVSPDNLQAPQVSLNQNGAFAPNNLGAQTNLFFGNAAYTAGLLSAPFTLPTAQNLTREELLARLRLLEQARAGLRARFAVLEDEARRSGVKID